jgi:hypothetical protein
MTTTHQHIHNFNNTSNEYQQLNTNNDTIPKYDTYWNNKLQSYNQPTMIHLTLLLLTINLLLIIILHLNLRLTQITSTSISILAILILAPRIHAATITDFPPFPTAAPSPTPPPHPSNPAVLLQQNTACQTLSSALSSCTAATIGFTTLPPSVQASCLCYSSSIFPQTVVFDKDRFDGAVKNCADYAQTAVPDAWGAIVNLEGFCG